ncbi:hypothetical protein BDZ91DRAFT_760772 [Kalaharituber pfeilii]|nr:hypothetical protein BDZ91DRAFT_760772 [Kalaharituber pfeilii]
MYRRSVCPYLNINMRFTTHLSEEVLKQFNPDWHSATVDIAEVDYPWDLWTSQSWKLAPSAEAYDATTVPNSQQVLACVVYGAAPMPAHSCSAAKLTMSLAKQPEPDIQVEDRKKPVNERAENFASMDEQSEKGKEVTTRRKQMEICDPEIDIAHSKQVSVRGKRARSNNGKGPQPNSTQCDEENQVTWIPYTPCAAHTFVPVPAPVGYSLMFAPPETVSTAAHLRPKRQRSLSKMEISDSTIRK